jgi:hypothetical protein
VIAAPVPVDMRALRALKRSPLALDLYAWATYRTFTVSRTRKPAFITWSELAAQIGADYADPKDFRRKGVTTRKSRRRPVRADEAGRAVRFLVRQSARPPSRSRQGLGGHPRPIRNGHRQVEGALAGGAVSGRHPE